MSGTFRQDLAITDPEAVATAGSQVGMRFGYGTTDPGFSYRLARAGDDQVTVSQVQLGGAMSFWGDTAVFMVSDVRGSRYDWQTRQESGSAAAGSPILFRPGHPALVVAQDLRANVSYLPVPLVQDVADTLYGTTDPVRFASSAPGSPGLGRCWSALARTATETAATPAFDEPLVRANLIRHLAVGMLECFPLIGDTDARDRSMDAQSRRYRAAVQFIDDYASLPITVEDAARAADTTTAALTRAFRANHSQGLTPAQYLRRTRLDAAHRDLLYGHPSAGDTVAAIAARWGFAHPGRFAAAYRAVYGITPRVTLER
ncbi:helix-turn-helix domain-containing protein [Kocuria flava]|uniref:helix-turn-helix domain-containing protein n=1 Tax=Kocuria flava TaxID=446860 RepID=UPI001FF465C1|nr:helix-turn-helix domain-containing protein [Kocuria flava]MCJ8505523.1 helix-turn-helix domain-containing protein [Kocuria flava]